MFDIMASFTRLLHAPEVDIFNRTFLKYGFCGPLFTAYVLFASVNVCVCVVSVLAGNDIVVPDARLQSLSVQSSADVHVESRETVI